MGCMAHATRKKLRAVTAANVFLGGVVALAIISFAAILVGGYAAYTVKRVVVPGA